MTQRGVRKPRKITFLFFLWENEKNEITAISIVQGKLPTWAMLGSIRNISIFSNMLRLNIGSRKDAKKFSHVGQSSKECVSSPGGQSCIRKIIMVPIQMEDKVFIDVLGTI